MGSPALESPWMYRAMWPVPHGIRLNHRTRVTFTRSHPIVEGYPPVITVDAMFSIFSPKVSSEMLLL
jgi:hypothetical protein